MTCLLPVMLPNFKSFPRHALGGRARYLPVAEALSGRYSFDAHTTAYSVPAIERRLAGNAPETQPGGGRFVTVEVAE